MTDPDRPWLDEEPPRTPEPADTFVFRVLYVSNQVEILRLLRRGRGGTAVVQDLEIEGEAGRATIHTHELFNSFSDAKNRLLELNAEKVQIARADLKRAEDRWRRANAMDILFE